VVLLLFSFSGLRAQALTLTEAYQSALEKSEDVANQVEALIQVEEKGKQATGALLPSLNGVGILQQQASGSVSAVFPTEQTTWKITAQQPLFRGLREYAALRQTHRQVEANEYQKSQAMTTVYITVASAYYQLLALEYDLKNLKTEIEVNQARLEELKKFRKIGRSRETEVLNSESAIAALEAQVESIQGQITSNRAVFLSLIGKPAETLLTDSESSFTEKTLKSLPDYLGRVDSRPDIQALIKQNESTQESLIIARGAHLPSVDLFGNYYLKRPGVLKNVDWDVQLALTLPIFQGGVTQSQVRAASSQVKQADLALEKARRSAREQIESAYDLVVSDLKQFEKSKKALDLSTRTYAAEQQDYRYGLVTNLEVLQSLTQSQESKRAVDRIHFQLTLDSLRLLTAVSESPKP
jgi:outer membrane protein